MARSGGEGCAMAGHAMLSSSGGGRGPSLPSGAAGVRGMRGSSSDVPAGSKSHGGCRGAVSATIEDNFNINTQDATKVDDVEEIFPNTQGPVRSQTHKNIIGVGCWHVLNVSAYSCDACTSLVLTRQIGQKHIKI
jgi:hypothetical protein